VSWAEELRRPATIISLVIGAVGTIAGTLSSLYFYEKGEKAGRISIAVEQVQVFDKSRIGQLPLRVLDTAGNVVTDNVFAANVTIWNSGNAEIKKEDVRKPFQLKFNTGLVPLDLTITQFSHDNIDGFEVTRAGLVDWKHFDPGEGIRIRLVYVSEIINDISLVGSAIGLNDFGRKVDRAEAINNLLGIAAHGLPVILGIFFGLFSLYQLIVKSMLSVRYKIFSILLMSFMAVFIFGMTVYFVFTTFRIPTPPFQ
jgi:hypothetical protein